jgi:uncharacterized protein involved in propanediol utilization
MMCNPSATGMAIAHHGELLQGIFENTSGQLRRGLLSLPCPALTSVATFHPTKEPVLTIAPTACEKARRAGELALSRVSPRSPGGHLQIATNISVGQGLGSSTADVLSSIQAITRFYRAHLSPEEIMRIAVAAETASDSTLFTQQAVLFAQRDGEVIEAFRKSLPRISLVSVNCAPDTEISTLDFQPAQYLPEDIEAFRPLRSLLRVAIDTGDLRALGRVTTASALINQRFLPKRDLHQIQAIADSCGAIGEIV